MIAIAIAIAIFGIAIILSFITESKKRKSIS